MYKRQTQVFPPPSEVNCTDADDEAAEQSQLPKCEWHYRAPPVTVRSEFAPWLAKGQCAAPFALRVGGTAAALTVRLIALSAWKYWLPWLAKGQCVAPFALRVGGTAAARSVRLWLALCGAFLLELAELATPVEMPCLNKVWSCLLYTSPSPRD